MNSYLKNKLFHSPARGSGLKGIFLLVIVLIISAGAKGQENIDSLINNDLPFFEDLQKQNFGLTETIGRDTLYSRIVPSVDMETIEDRASCLELDMPLVINKTVCGFIHFFTVRKRNYTQTMLERKNYYFPIFEYYLRKHQMPDALKYLSIVESGLNYKARSRTGAVGLWQFMPGTGKDFYLAQNQHIDERQNPYLATEAACKFLKYLYGMFNDWELALAAYNCGPGNVMKAMRKSGKRGFWEIYNFLPQETRSYVPQFHAVVYSMNFAEEHNIRPDLDSVLVTVPLDTFQISRKFDVERLEKILGLPGKTLQQHNPTLRTGTYPGLSKYPLLVPSSHSAALAQNLNCFIDSAAVTPMESGFSDHQNLTKTYRWVKVGKGESLRSIAQRFNVSYTSLCRLNHQSGRKVSRSHKIRIPVLPQKAAGIQGSKAAENLENSGTHEPAKNKTNLTEGTHIVSRGEKLYQIAIEYGITTQQLRKWNHMTTSHVNEGQILRLKPDVPLLPQNVTDSCSSSGAPEFHIVRRGERLFSIAKTYGLSLKGIQDLNPGLGNHLVEGQEIRIKGNPDQIAIQTEDSAKAGLKVLSKKNSRSSKIRKEESGIVSKTYLVQKGDTLYSITRKFTRLTIKDLMRINKLKDKNIKPGQQLIVG